MKRRTDRHNVKGLFQSAPDAGALTAEALAERVLEAFGPRQRVQFTAAEILTVVGELGLAEDRRARRAPGLRLDHLRFTGAKQLRGDDTPRKIDYQQNFSGGVNVVLIPDNDVGKSSILKTIRFALTGEDQEYDADVRCWITDVWLGFVLDDRPFTAVLGKRDGQVQAVLVPDQETRPVEEAQEHPQRFFHAVGQEAVKDALQTFYFERLGLSRLSWIMSGSSAGGAPATQCGTSWLTYFQGMEIPDGGDVYLLCDPQHSFGNQEGLIFSSFLGLHLVEQLNRFSVAISQDSRIEKASEEQIQEIQAHIDTVEGQLREVRQRLENIAAAQQSRRATVLSGTATGELQQAESAVLERITEQSELIRERDRLNDGVRRGRAQERQATEAIALHLHFSGLEVVLCPNCDSSVDETDVEREHQAHSCRLCSKPAHQASEQEMETLRAALRAVQEQLQRDMKMRDSLTARLSTVHSEVDDWRRKADLLRQLLRGGVEAAFPTTAEQDQRDRLLRDSGRLQADLTVARQRLESLSAGGTSAEKRHKILKKAREVLQEIAEERNGEILRRLNELTQDVACRIGAESISDVSCSSLGKISLTKHGTKVAFTGIKNPGERLRVKLAFFLGMMRLGREPGFGRHPGFLLIDQPGSAEMVPEDFTALAKVFKQIDSRHSEDVQVICFTARPEFSAATKASKVYGPQAGRFAF